MSVPLAAKVGRETWKGIVLLLVFNNAIATNLQKFTAT